MFINSVTNTRLLDVPKKFNRNAASIKKAGFDKTGVGLMALVCEKVGLQDLSQSKVLDVGCGVRFAQAIVNCQVPIKEYVGVDIYPEMVEWLQHNVDEDKLSFHNWDVHHGIYNRTGTKMLASTPLPLSSGEDFDLIWLFSVFTHLGPEDAKSLLHILRRYIRPEGHLFFSAFIDNSITDYDDRFPGKPLKTVFYHEDYLRSLMASAGWEVEARYPKDPSRFIQHHFVCRPSATPPSWLGMVRQRVAELFR